MWIAEVAEQQMKELYISKEIKQAKSFLSSHDCKREWWKQEKKRIYLHALLCPALFFLILVIWVTNFCQYSTFSVYLGGLFPIKSVGKRLAVLVSHNSTMKILIFHWCVSFSFLMENHHERVMDHSFFLPPF